MNLNISTQFTNNFQGNSNSTKLNCIKGEFVDIFKESKNFNENIELDKEINEEDEQKNIDYELLQNILNNLSVVDQLGVIKTSFNLEAKAFNNMHGLAEILKKIDLENISQVIKNNENNQIISNNLYEKILINKYIKHDELIKNILPSDNYNDLEIHNELMKNNLSGLENSQTSDKNVIGNVNNFQEIKNYNYVDSINKNNLFYENKHEIIDKDLITLNSILEENDNNFIIQNNLGASNINNFNNNLSDISHIKEIRKEFINEDIVQTIKYLKSNGIEEIKIKITPRELGEMTIKLIKNIEETKVAITITKEDIFDLVKKNISEISKHLNDLNIKVKDIVVEIKQDSQKDFNNNLSQDFNKNNQQDKQRKSRYKSIKLKNENDIKEFSVEDDNLNILI